MLGLSDINNLSREMAQRIINRACGDMRYHYGDAPKINKRGQIEWHSGAIFPHVIIEEADYTVKGEDVIVVMKSSAASRTVTLPPGEAEDGHSIIIKRWGTRSISIVPDGTETIDGSASFTLNVNYKTVGLIGSGEFPGYIVAFSYL